MSILRADANGVGDGHEANRVKFIVDGRAIEFPRRSHLAACRNVDGEKEGARKTSEATYAANSDRGARDKGFQ